MGEKFWQMGDSNRRNDRVNIADSPGTDSRLSRGLIITVRSARADAGNFIAA
jgi:hypothetical protein